VSLIESWVALGPSRTDMRLLVCPTCKQRGWETILKGQGQLIPLEFLVKCLNCDWQGAYKELVIISR